MSIEAEDVVGRNLWSTNSGVSDQAVTDILSKILLLPSEHRLKLANAWKAVDDALSIYQQSSKLSESSNDELAVEDDLVEVRDWLMSLKKLEPREALKRLDAALSEEEGQRPWASEIIAVERRRLLETNRMLLVEYIFSKYAYQNPLFTAIAFFGFGFALYRLGKGMFNLIF